MKLFEDVNNTEISISEGKLVVKSLNQHLLENIELDIKKYLSRTYFLNLCSKNFGQAELLSSMINKIGVRIDDIDFTNPNWNFQYSWAKKQEQEFIEVMVDKIYNSNLRIILGLHKRKTEIKNFVNEFVSSYGWKRKD